MRILIAGGGTGGHVVPALAIGREMRDRYSADLLFVGTSRGIESRLVPAAGFRLALVPAGQLKNVSRSTQIKTVLDLPRGVLQCMRLMRNFQPGAVVGVGGYASGPAMLAAILLRLPTVVYEPNAVPGLVNRVIGRAVTASVVNFPATGRYLRNAEVTGVPVREEIFAIPPYTPSQPPHLLVTAGSNGARVFNETLPEIMPALLSRLPGLTVTHQTGERALATTDELYRRSGIGPDRLEVRAFLTDMPDQFRRASLVLARSGSTVAELAAAGRASLLVPFPQAADDHQTANARAMVQARAAELLPQSELTAPLLLDRLFTLLGNPERLATLATNARRIAKPGALHRIGEIVAGLATGRRDTH